jgi:hypothetical protein
MLSHQEERARKTAWARPIVAGWGGVLHSVVGCRWLWRPLCGRRPEKMAIGVVPIGLEGWASEEFLSEHASFLFVAGALKYCCSCCCPAPLVSPQLLLSYFTNECARISGGHYDLLLTLRGPRSALAGPARGRQLRGAVGQFDSLTDVSNVGCRDHGFPNKFEYGVGPL